MCDIFDIVIIVSYANAERMSSDRCLFYALAYANKVDGINDFGNVIEEICSLAIYFLLKVDLVNSTKNIRYFH